MTSRIPALQQVRFVGVEQAWTCRSTLGVGTACCVEIFPHSFALQAQVVGNRTERPVLLVQVLDGIVARLSPYLALLALLFCA
jgi:hypothetical protein